ncbi:hypothetical protein [Variovorax soli]|uniref:Uncharacterized protein n=1 Tax=Variovorax soli TaxID=376815 RepID=A0ABU1NBB4_9BURK|nr:hypothetical protein [Variovorax soli]MDR6535597.1 hypothetical protein [Variovorax soli]
MSTLRSVEQLADYAGLVLTRDEERRQWIVQRGAKVVHRARDLDDVQGFLVAWSRYVR